MLSCTFGDHINQCVLCGGIKLANSWVRAAQVYSYINKEERRQSCMSFPKRPTRSKSACGKKLFLNN